MCFEIKESIEWFKYCSYFFLLGSHSEVCRGICIWLLEIEKGAPVL